MTVDELNTDKLVHDLQRVMRDSEELLRTTAGAAEEKALEVRERLARAVERAKETCQRLEAKTIEGAKAADKTIREHPYQSIGVAFGVGLLIGAVAARK